MILLEFSERPNASDQETVFEAAEALDNTPFSVCEFCENGFFDWLIE